MISPPDGLILKLWSHEEPKFDFARPRSVPGGSALSNVGLILIYLIIEESQQEFNMFFRSAVLSPVL
jgi:hypothetical protein